MASLAILTPTYNRAYILDTLFQSLQKQSCKDFVWYIVDDGSADNTEQLCERFQKEASFPVVYLKKENGGKHTALNVGIAEITEELTFVVDSDDYLTEDAVQTVVSDWSQYRAQEEIGGLCYYKLYQDGSVVGDRYPGTDVIVDTYTNLRINQNVQGDKAEVYRTAILKQYPFPVFENERFLSEAIVWNAIGRAGYKLAYIGRGIYVCEYLGDGLTQSGRAYRMKNPLGTMEHARSFLYPEVKRTIRLKYVLLYIATCVCARQKLRRAFRRVDQKAAFACMFPLGLMLGLWWRIKYKI